MITFKELSEAVYEDLNGHIVTVSDDDKGYRILFRCNDWHDLKKTRQFELVFDGVQESNATPSASGGLRLLEEHPLLWQHNSEHVSMFFSSAPSRPLEMIGHLYEAHTRLFGRWREFTDYLRADLELLRGGQGLLARGPKRAIQEYAKVIGNELRHSIVQGHTPRGGYRVVVFDECYVVCRDVSVIEGESIQSDSENSDQP